MKNITDFVLKFIEDLDYREKSSPKTVIAYAGDIYQVFREYLPGTIQGPAINNAEDYSYIVNGEITPKSCDLEMKNFENIIRAYLLSIKGMEISSRARKIATLRKFFLYLKSEHIVDELPRILVTPKAAQKLPHLLSVDEVMAVLKLFATTATSERDTRSKALFLLLYGAGLRVSEACELQWSHVNLLRRELRILGKGNKERMISMPTLVQLNIAAIRTQNQKYIWGDKPLNTRTAYNYIAQLGRKAGLAKPIHPHALRHSFATHLMSDGADIRVIQEMLGHSSLAATEKYTHVSTDQLSRTMEKFHPLSRKIGS